MNQQRKPGGSRWRPKRLATHPALARPLLASTGWVTLALTALPPEHPLRVGAVFAFTLICPGLAIAILLTGDLLLRSVLAIALSLALAVIVSVTATVMRLPDFPERLVALAIITTAAAALGAVLQLRAPAPEGAL